MVLPFKKVILIDNAELRAEQLLHDWRISAELLLGFNQFPSGIHLKICSIADVMLKTQIGD